MRKDIEQIEWEQGIDEFFEALFKKVEEGAMTYEQMEGFFPKEVKDRAKQLAT